MQIIQGKFNLFLFTYCIYGKNVLSLHQDKLITIKTITTMKKMYALNYTNNGNGLDSRPYGSTIAVSTDIEKLRVEMQRCIEEDCLETDDDFEGDMYAHNFQIYREYDNGNNISVELESKLDIELTATYLIHEVGVL